MKPAHRSTPRGLRLLGATIGALLLGAGAPPLRAQASNCATVKAVMSKMETVPYHMYLLDSANTDAARHGGKPTTGEVISAGGSMYVLTHGKWVKSPVSLAEMKKSRDTTLLAKETCSHVRDESVNGEAAEVWRTHMVNEMATYDTDIWISKSRGLVLRSNALTDVGGPMGKHRSIARYDYSNVRPPAGVP
jgi:hypothetical protein